MIARRLRSERGWALVTAMMVIGLMTTAGLATYAVVDTQTNQSRVERTRESAFYLADAALNEQAFLLSRDWANDQNVFPSSCTPTTGGDPCPAGTGAWQSQFNTPDYRGAAWTTVVSDDDGTNFYPGTATAHYDANGNGLLWVTATATAQGKTRKVVAEVQWSRIDLSAVFPHNVITAGSFKTTNSGNKVLVDTQGNATKSSPLDVRCAQVGPGCLDYRDGQISPDTAAIGYSGGSALDPSKIASLKDAARSYGTLYSTCPSSLTGRVVYIVSGGCSYVGNSQFNSPDSPGVVVVEDGSLYLGGTVNFYGVVYMVNRSNSSGTVFTTQGNATVTGSVAVDGDGGVDAGSSALNVGYDPNAFNALQGAGQAGIVQNSWRELLNR